jgi:hypothetical protein
MSKVACNKHDRREPYDSHRAQEVLFLVQQIF